MPISSDFGSVTCCRRPVRLVRSPTCDGQGRHRRTCSGSNLWAFDRRMGADSPRSRGIDRGAAACRGTGFRADGELEARAGTTDPRGGPAAGHGPCGDHRVLELRQHRAQPNRHRSRVERSSSRRREEEPRGRPDADRATPPRALRERQRRLDARSAARCEQSRRHDLAARRHRARIETGHTRARRGQEVQARGRDPAHESATGTQ